MKPASRIIRKMTGSLICLVILAGTMIPAQAVWTGEKADGANINESAIVRHYYVDGPNPAASDSNNGSQSAPFKTIGFAVNLAMYYKDGQGGTKIHIRPGVYREQLNLQGRKNDTPVILEGTESGVVVTGAEAYTGWQVSGSNYYHSWSYDWGLSPDVYLEYGIQMHELVRRREMVFVNGELMLPVLSQSALQPGTFYVSESQDRIYLRPSTGTNMTTAQVEVSHRDRVVMIDGTKSIVLRNLTLTRGACGQGGAGVVAYQSDQVLIEDCVISQNSYYGMGAHLGSGITLRNTRFPYNGGGGFNGSGLSNILFEDCETSYNNWRGALGQFYDWDTGGIKILFSSQVSIDRHKSLYNQAPGVWFDSVCKSITITNSDISYNDYAGTYSSVIAGIYLEGGVGPYFIDRCTVTYNRRGLNLASVEDVYVRDSEISGNQYHQIALFSNWGQGRPFQGEATSYLRRTVLQNTVIAAPSGSTTPLFGWDHGDTAAYGTWQDTLKTRGVRYYHPSAQQAFYLTGTNKGPLESWIQMSGVDSDAVWLTSEYLPDSTPGTGLSLVDYSLWRMNYYAGSSVVAAAGSGGSIEKSGDIFPLDTANSYNGCASLRVNVTGTPSWWFGAVLKNLDLTAFPADTQLRFALKGNAGGEQFMAGFKSGGSNAGMLVTASSSWQTVSIPLSSLLAAYPSFPADLVDGFAIYSANNNALKIWIADVRLYSESAEEAISYDVAWSLNYSESLPQSAGMLVSDSAGSIEKSSVNQLFPMDGAQLYEGQPSMRLQVTGTPAWWIGMLHGNINLTEHRGRKLQFAVKGQTGGERFYIGFKSGSANAGMLVTAGTQWTAVTINIDDLLAAYPSFPAASADGFVLYSYNNAALKVWLADIKITGEAFPE